MLPLMLTLSLTSGLVSNAYLIYNEGELYRVGLDLRNVECESFKESVIFYFPQVDLQLAVRGVSKDNASVN